MRCRLEPVKLLQTVRRPTFLLLAVEIVGGVQEEAPEPRSGAQGCCGEGKGKLSQEIQARRSSSWQRDLPASGAVRPRPGPAGAFLAKLGKPKPRAAAFKRPPGGLTAALVSW